MGAGGKVTGIEFDPALAARAQANLSSNPNVRVVKGDGALTPFDPADVIYVSAGATRPADVWLDGLSEGGRLIVPLTTDRGFLDDDSNAPLERRGAMFLFERRTPERFLAKWLSPAAHPCESARMRIGGCSDDGFTKVMGAGHALLSRDTVPEALWYALRMELAYH